MGVASSKSVVKTKVMNKLSSIQRTNVINTCSAKQIAQNIFKLDLSGDSAVTIDNINQINELKNNCEFKVALNELVQTQQDADLALEFIKTQDTGLFGISNSNSEAISILENVMEIENIVEIINDSVQDVDAVNIFELALENASSVDILEGVNQSNAVYNESLNKVLSEKAGEYVGTAKSSSKISEIISTGFNFGSATQLIIIAIIIAAIYMAMKKKK